MCCLATICSSSNKALHGELCDQQGHQLPDEVNMAKPSSVFQLSVNGIIRSNKDPKSFQIQFMAYRSYNAPSDLILQRDGTINDYAYEEDDTFSVVNGTLCEGSSGSEQHHQVKLVIQCFYKIMNYCMQFYKVVM